MYKLTSYLTQNFDEIVIEDLNVKGMMRNRHLARAILDMGFHELRRELIYKSKLRGCHVVAADRWFPSSKACSRCYVIKEELSLGERLFRCEACGLVIDRDLNAANNVARIVFDPWSTVSSTNLRELKPGERRALAHACVWVKLAFMKQESSDQI